MSSSCSSKSRAPGRSRGYTGLFHFALLLPARVELARWLAHAGRDGVPVDGLSDHYVSEAIYSRTPTGTASRSTQTGPASSGKARSRGA